MFIVAIPRGRSAISASRDNNLSGKESNFLPKSKGKQFPLVETTISSGKESNFLPKSKGKQISASGDDNFI
jgi:hypothetical protein